MYLAIRNLEREYIPNATFDRNTVRKRREGHI